MRRFTAILGFGVVGTVAALLAAGRAEAASEPEVTTILEAKAVQDMRPMLILVGKRLGAIRTFALKEPGGADAGALTTIYRRSSEIGLGLPVAVAPGAYDLEVTFGRQGMKTYPVTVTAGAYLSLADGGTVAGPLEVASEDGVLFGGTFGGGGSIPASGAGTRFLWHPAKAALRAGSVTGVQWDDVNVGQHSAAMGQDTIASGDGSMALGSGTAATAFAAFAAGSGTTASGQASVAMGSTTTSSGFGSFAVGGLNTTASANYSVAMGGGTVASALGSFAAGGFASTASNTYAVAMGEGALASGYASTALGSQSTASEYCAIAGGFDTTASGQRSVALCTGTTASGFAATALGDSTTAQSSCSLAIGRFNTISGDPFFVVATDPLFVAGNGTSAAAPSNALTLLRNGNMTIAGTLTESSDARLKTDVVPLAGVLPRLAGVRAVAYRFLDGERSPGGPQVGLLAQEVRDAFPELVREAPDGTLSVSYGRFTAVLLAAVQEQEAEIAALREELRRSREDVASRLARLESLAAGAGAGAR